MKLAVSNIAWEDAEEDAVFALLAAHGVGGIEVAPTRLWPDWAGATPAAARAAAARIAARGFRVPSLQSLLFARPALSVFGDAAAAAALLDHLERVAALAAAFGAGPLVFGSPRNRDPGDLTPAAAAAQAAGLFRRAAERVARHGAVLCLEPNPPAYGCRFVTTWREAADLVRQVDHPGFGLHLDTGCIHMAGDDPAQAIAESAGILRHFHASEPQLGDFAAPAVDHARAAAALRAAGYEGWVSLEMRRPAGGIGTLEQAVARVAAWYG